MSSRSCGAFAYTPARRRSAPSYSAINRRKISLHRSSGCAAVSIAFKQVVCLYPKTLRVVFGGVEPAGSRVNQSLEHRPKSLSKPCIVDVIRWDGKSRSPAGCNTLPSYRRARDYGNPRPKDLLAFTERGQKQHGVARKTVTLTYRLPVSPSNRLAISQSRFL